MLSLLPTTVFEILNTLTFHELWGTFRMYVLAIHQFTDTLSTFNELKLKNILEIQQCCDTFLYASFQIGLLGFSVTLKTFYSSPLPVRSCKFWPLLWTQDHLTSGFFLGCHTYCNTGHPFVMIISLDPWHSHHLCQALAVEVLLPVLTTSCPYRDSNTKPSACEANSLTDFAICHFQWTHSRWVGGYMAYAL